MAQNKLYASWVHGHSVQAEAGGSILRLGMFSRITGSDKRWFHFAIPTPVIVDNERLRLNQVLLRYRGTATIKAVHVYDGDKKIAWFDNLAEKAPEFGMKPFVLAEPKPEVEWGIGVSILVSLSDIDLDPAYTLDVASVGGDFIHTV